MAVLIPAYRNPAGGNYDEARYGPPGSHTGAEQFSSVAPQQQLYTDPQVEKKQDGILRQIMSVSPRLPPNDPSLTVERNPGGDKADSLRYGNTASTEPPQNTTTGTGVNAPTGAPATSATGTAGQGQHQYGRDAALAAGAGAAGVGAYGAGRHSQGHQSGLTAQPGNTLDRPTPGDDGATVASIKSGVLSGSPTQAKRTDRTAVTTGQQQAGDDLPRVPATGGKFMGEGYDSNVPR
jgi:hypothetical protein